MINLFSKEELKEIQRLSKTALEVYGKEDKYDRGCFGGDRAWYNKKYAKAQKRTLKAQIELSDYIEELNG